MQTGRKMGKRNVNILTAKALSALSFLFLAHDIAVASGAPVSGTGTLYVGVGYSGSQFGRTIPGAHAMGGLYGLQVSGFSVGVESQVERSVHHNLSLTYTVTEHVWRYFFAAGSIGAGVQRNQRQYLTEAPDHSAQSEWDHRFGPAFSLTACVFQHICLRLEGFLGWDEIESTAQVYAENTIGSLGVRL